MTDLGYVFSGLREAVASLDAVVLESIILAALYLYAAEGRIPDQFQGDAIEAAF